MKVYIYCTKAKPNIGLNGKVIACFDLNKVEEINCCFVPYRKENNLGYESFIDNGVYHNEDDKEWEKQYNQLSGLVFERNDRYIDTMLKNEDFKKMCLTPMDIWHYLKGKKEKGYGKFYNWHIENLQVFDEPMELKDFYYTFTNCGKENTSFCIRCCSRNEDPERISCWCNRNNKWFDSIEKAPSSWCYAQETQAVLDENENLIKKCILISIKPQQVEKILNGEQTIIVRKTAPKELLEKH